MAYPEKPTGTSALDHFEEDFAYGDDKKLPMDDVLFKYGYKNASESEEDTIPNAHQHNWLFNLFYKNIRYCMGTSEENRSAIDNLSLDIKQLSDDFKEWLKKYLISPMPIGAVYSLVCSPDYIPDGSLPCDGKEYSYNEYQQLYDNYLACVPSKLKTCSYTEYSNMISAYGSCPVIALDTTNKKFKLPLIKDGAVIQQAKSNNSLYKAFNAGLPNISATGFIGEDLTNGKNFLSQATGSLYYSGTGDDDTILYYGTKGGIDKNNSIGKFDASLSSPVYGKSDTVQMNAVSLRYFIVVANGATNISQFDWDKYNDTVSQLQAVQPQIVIWE